VKSFVLRLLVVGAAIGLLIAAPALWFLVIIGAWIGWGIATAAGQSGRDEERARRQSALDQAARDFEALVGRARQECGPEAFNAKKQELIKLRNEYQGLQATENAEITKLQTTVETRQKQRFLERFFIDSASISGVGPAKKAALRSFGIETAADVSSHKVRAVHGFGEVLTRTVVEWRQACERRFVFDPRVGVSEAEKNAVRSRIYTRRRQLEAVLSGSAAELQRLQQGAVIRARAIQPQLVSAAGRVAQSRADRALL
jgi:DNA-binding helix-hairpin-helix protein with protein kinase domain